MSATLQLNRYWEKKADVVEIQTCVYVDIVFVFLLVVLNCSNFVLRYPMALRTTIPDASFKILWTG